MNENRPPIPAGLQRNLMIESGYRCAICKTTDPLEIEHIVEWSKVREHTFENMIVLCANCHSRKKNTSDPRHINQSSLKQIKANLMMLNGRYSDLERRVIHLFKDHIDRGEEGAPQVMLPADLSILVANLQLDGIVWGAIYQSGISTSFKDGTVIRNDMLKLTLTPEGAAFLQSLLV